MLPKRPRGPGLRLRARTRSASPPASGFQTRGSQTQSEVLATCRQPPKSSRLHPRCHPLRERKRGRGQSAVAMAEPPLGRSWAWGLSSAHVDTWLSSAHIKVSNIPETLVSNHLAVSTKLGSFRSLRLCSFWVDGCPDDPPTRILGECSQGAPNPTPAPPTGAEQTHGASGTQAWSPEHHRGQVSA